MVKNEEKSSENKWMCAREENKNVMETHWLQLNNNNKKVKNDNIYCEI